MADNLTAEQRKRNMANIRSRHTKPELIVRSIIHGLGYRFRLHDKKLPGKPDIVLPRHKKIILIHGCFWHMHDCKRGNVTPKTNVDYWQNKRFRNVARDKDNLSFYANSGFNTLIIWECEVKDKDALTNKLKEFLIKNNNSI
jgi:DNA mismatch endonuclease, patch repair protein